MAFIPHDNNLGVLRGLIEAGQSNIEIANHLGCTKKTVCKWRMRLRDGVPMEDLRRYNSGQFKISNENLERVVEAFIEQPFDTLRNVHARLGIPGNIHTLSRAIRSRTDMRFRKPAKKPLLRDQDYALRLAYAYAHLERTPLDWRKTVFMDEKTFSSTKDGKFN
uniref:Transposase n=1 Tax=Trichogramma kaykai TaxID=54128 RepID=A0ABD2VW62_9HYME